MSRKRRRNKNGERKKNRASLPSGEARKRLVLEIVKTDSTFELHTFRDGHQVWCGKCIHCNARMTVPKDGCTGWTIEHILPRCADGQNDLRNLALACGGCNQEKGRRHDMHVGKGGRADEIVSALQAKRLSRWREPQ